MYEEEAFVSLKVLDIEDLRVFGSHGSEGGFPPSIKYIFLLLLPAFTAFRKSLGRLEPELGESRLSRTCFH